MVGRGGEEESLVWCSINAALCFNRIVIFTLGSLLFIKLCKTHCVSDSFCFHRNAGLQ